jgi:hypothetical protein
MLTQIKANGTTIGPSSTKYSAEDVVPHLDLGVSALDSVLYYSKEGLIKLKPPEEWATSANIWCPTIDATIDSPIIVNQELIIDRTKARTANSLASLATYADIPTTLLVTALGSLDIQFSIQNKLTSSVDSSGTPNYISNFVCNYFSGAPLNTGYSSTTNDNYNNMGTPQSGPPSIIGNASSKGVNYTIINAQYNRDPSNYDDSGNLISTNNFQTPSSRLSYTSGSVAVNVMGIITLVIDAAVASGLEDNKYMVDDPTRINPKWRGNFKYTAFSSLFKIREERFWNRAYNHNNFAQEIQMVAVTADQDSANYGKFNVTIKAESSSSEFAKNLGFRWLVSIVKNRNFIT